MIHIKNIQINSSFQSLKPSSALRMIKKSFKVKFQEINLMVSQNYRFRKFLIILLRNLNILLFRSFYHQAILLNKNFHLSKYIFLFLVDYHFKILLNKCLRQQIRNDLNKKLNYQIHFSSHLTNLLNIYLQLPFIILRDLIQDLMTINLYKCHRLNINRHLIQIFLHFSNCLRIYHCLHTILHHNHVFCHLSIPPCIYLQKHNDKPPFHFFSHLKSFLNICLCLHKQFNLYLKLDHQSIHHHKQPHLHIEVLHSHFFYFLTILQYKHLQFYSNMFLFHIFIHSTNSLNIFIHQNKQKFQIHFFYLQSILLHILLNFCKHKFLFLVQVLIGIFLDIFNHQSRCKFLHHKIYLLSNFPYKRLYLGSYRYLFHVCSQYINQYINRCQDK